MFKNLANMFRSLFGRRTRKSVAADRRRDFLNQFRKGRVEGLEDRALMTTLAPGDIAVLAFNSNAPDGFTFVPWVPVDNGTVIKFTDNGFLSTNASTATNNGRGGENFVTWTNNTGNTIPAGTVLSIINGTGASQGSVAQTLSGISSSGDQIFAYQGAGTGATTSTSDFGTNVNPSTFTGTILHGLNFASDWLSTGVASSNTSYLPSDLSASNSIAFTTSGTTGGQYTGPRSGQTLTQFKALVDDTANWTTLTGASTVTLDTSAFTIASGPTVTSPTHTSVTDTAATLGGNVTAGTGITERGVVYSLTGTNNDPLIGGTGVTKVIEGGTTTGVFTVGVTGLTASSGYSYKAYAIDGGGTSYSSVATFTTQAPVGAHQAPSGTDKAITFNEDSTYIFSAADFAFTDSDLPAQSLNRVQVTTLPALGTLTLSALPVVAGDFITAANISNLLYTPVANANGTPYSTFTFQVEDTGSTAGGGQILDVTPSIITLNINSVNDVPAGADKTVAASIASGYTFSVGDFGFVDSVADVPANTLLAVKVTTLPAVGSLTNDNVAVTVGQNIAVADITGGKLKFTPAIGATAGAAYASFTFQVQDNGGTSNGGVDLDASANTVTIDLTAASQLAVGDIAFTAFQADNAGGAGGDFYEFVALRDLAAGTTIYFTDGGFTTAFATGENVMRWVAQSAVTAGTKFSFTSPNGAGTANTAEWTGINPVTGAELTGATAAAQGLSTSGESITALFNPVFGGTNLLTGTAIAAVYFGDEPTTLPAGLVLGTNAVSVGSFDNGHYDPNVVGSVETGSISAVRASINTVGNWEVNENVFTTAGTAATFTILNLPEINLQGNSVSIADGDTTPSTTDNTDFGGVVQGASAIDRTFTIQNTGTLTLNLSGGPNFVSISGGSNFSILTQPASGTIAAGGSETFVVRMNPAALGTQTASIVINSDDADEAVYNFDLSVVVTSSVASTTTALTTVNPLTPNAGDSVNFAGTVIAGSGTATPVGTIEIRDGGATGTLLASTTTIGGSGANGTFSINTTAVPAGTYSNIQAFFVPGPGFTASESTAFGSPLTVTLATFVSYATASSTITQSFDSLVQVSPATPSGNGPHHIGDAAYSASPAVSGWYFSKYGGSGANALFFAGDGSASSGAVYSYGVAGTNPISDRALGSVSSGTTIPRFGAVIRNTSGTTLDTFTITFDGEQWRRGDAAANTLTFDYKVGSAAGTENINTVTGTTADPALNFTAPVTTGTAGLLDGNAPANRTAGITKTISGISWANGTDLIIRWTDINDTGADDGLAIDNFSFSAISQYPNGSLSFSSPTFSVAENGTTATVLVTRSGSTAGAVSVVASTVVGGTAVAGTDYTTSSATLNWAAGDNTPQPLTIPIANNALLEQNKTINLQLTTPGGGALIVGNSTAVLTIREDEMAAQVLLNEVLVNPSSGNDRPFEFVEVRGTAGAVLANWYVVQIDGTSATAGNAHFVTELSGATLGSNGILAVTAVSGGHAVNAPSTQVTNAALDITNGTGLLNNAQTMALIFSTTPLTVNMDLDTNNDGTLDLPAGATLIDAVGWKDNSSPNNGLYAGFVYGGVEILNTNTPFDASTSGTPDAATRFFNNTSPLTSAAWFGGDITDTGDPATVSYDPAKATTNLPVGGASLSPALPNTGLSISAGAVSLAEGASGTTTFTFTISRAGDVSTAQDVTWTVTGSGTNPATASDFVGNAFPTGLAQFAINDATKVITIDVAGDATIEFDERFTVTLSNPTNGAVISSATASSTITNDDFQTLAAGDVVITGINTSGFPDQFSFVPLVNLTENSQLIFTDNAFDGSVLGTTEGSLTYTAPAGGIAAGTKIVIQSDGTTSSVLTGPGTVSSTSGFSLNASGENLFVYNGLTSAPTFLFGLTTNTSYLTTGSTTSSTTYLPAALTIGTSAVAPFDATVTANAQYTGATTGTAAVLRALVADEANWTTSGTALTLSPTNFTLSAPNQAPTDIDLAGTTIAENAGANATVGTLSTVDPDAGNTFTYTLVPGTGSTGNAAFNINGSTLRATSSLDFETQSSYSIRVRSTDQGGAFFEEVFTITVTNVVEPLQVTSLTPTSSGFVATFSEAFNPAELNLYGNAALGLTDVTLVGATTGTIRGSLMLNAANNRIEFVRTQSGATASTASGILPNDTYTVTLRSAGGTTTDGFNTAANVALDGGVGDIAPGGEYTTTFVVNNPVGAVRVSLPDFTRGHGQAVNVPNTSTGLPLYISTGQNVSSLKMTLTYDPALLSITGFTLSSALQTAGVTATPNFDTAGVVILDITHTTELSAAAGALTLGTFTATVPTTALYGAKQVLDITSLEVFDNAGVPAERASIGDDAVHVSAYFGDASGNRQLQSNDGTLLARVNALLDTGFAALQMADPVLIADFSSNNQLQSNDGTLLARFNALIATPQIPAVPAAPVPLPSLATDPVLAIGAPTTTPAAGSSFTVPLTLTVPATESLVGGVTSLSVLIEFDESKLTLVTNTGYSTVGTAAAGFGVTPNQIDNGTTRTLVFDVQGGINTTVAINPGETIILGFLTFSIPVGVTGSFDLNLLGSFQTVTTAVFDDGFSELFLTNGDGVTPAPTNGFDPNNDLTINLGLGPNQAPTAVSVTPNPASIAENTAVPSNLLVGTISITDDGQGTNTLSLVGADASSFTIVGNQIFLNAGTSLDFETKPSYTVTVQADDTTVGATPDATILFTLDVSNVNEAPTVTPATFTLAENSANGTTVGTVTATDPDAGDTIASWAITGGNTGGAFAISSTGVITVANVTAVDFETNPTFTLAVTATDAGGQTSAAGTVTINLTDVFEAISPIYINEIFWNPQGTDAPNEFFELRGTPGAVIPVGTYLVGIEGDNTGGTPNPGDLNDVFPLGGLTFGSNGLILFLQKGSTYSTTAAVTAGTTIVQNAGAGAGWGSGTTGGSASSIGHLSDASATDIENGNVTFMIVSSTVPATATDDIDVNNDGTPDGAFANWTVLDSIGALHVTDAGFGYAALNIKNGTGPSTSVTGTVVQISGEVEYAARYVGSTGATAADWLAGDTVSLTGFRMAGLPANMTDGAYRGSPLDHIGLPNNFTLVAPTDIALSSATIPENSATGSTIGSFTTTDPTGGDTHTYSLVAGTGSTDNAAFTITGGVLTINGSANFEAQPSYSIRVRTTDSVGATFEKVFTISVTNVNETPTIAAQTFSIAENSANGTVVGTVVANDVDAGDTLSYTITAGNIGGAFAINPTTGQITVDNGSALNFETFPSFALTVRVTDAGTLFASETVTINLTDVNEAPIFGQASYSFSIPENSSAGTAVGAVSATDFDSGASLTYSLSGPGSSNFDINPTTGAITVAAGAVLNFEVTPSFVLSAGVTDGTNPVTVPVTISLTNVNEVPTIAAQTFSVSEQAAIGAAVGTVVAVDPDAGDSLTYVITTGNTGGAFAINPSTGAITVAAALDFNTTPVYTLTVSVTDLGSLSASNTVTINVTNVNSAPTINPQTFTVPENSANGTTVGTVIATDIDVSDLLTFAITGGNTSGAFAISSGGVLTVANGAALDLETTPSYSLTVSVTDNGIPVGSSSATITINLTNVNEAPTIAAQTFSVAENSANGSAVGTVLANDVDAGDTKTFAITGGTGSGLFAISNSGAITVANGSLLDFETLNTYSLTVSVTDSGSLSASNTVTVNLNDVNEAPTNILLSNSSIAENAGANALVGSLSATDPDAGSTFTFSLPAGLVDNAAFNISGTSLRANSSFNFEAQSSYTVTVRVTDQGGSTFDKNFTISVTGVNEAPVVSPMTATIAENSANGSIVDQILATDPDLGDILSYSLSGPGSANFSVNASGQITVANSAALDYETVAGHVFNLMGRATDVGGLFTEAAVTITLSDVNEAPSFGAASYTFSVLDTAASNGSNVGTVAATDPDAGATLAYSLSPVGNGIGAGAFAINPVTGQITVNDVAQINFFVTPLFNLTALVSDGTNSVSVPVVVNITHTNQNPTFITLSNNSVAENLPIGTVVGSFSTTDGDLPNDNHTYTLLTTGTGSTDFASFSLLGNQLFTNASFDYEAKSSYTIRVRTTDQGGGTFDRIFTVFVTNVVESGNQAPTNISLSGSQTVTPTGTTGTPVGTLSTTDPNPGNTFVYNLEPVGDFAKFQVDGAILRLASNVSDPVGTVYSISITSTDQGGLSYTKNFTITVAVAPNVAPTYITLSVNSVSENMPINTVVGTFATTDANPGDTHTYTLLTTGTGSTDHASFNITGNQLRTSASFDYETKTSYNIRVRTTDQGGLSFERVFTVYVTNVVETGNQAPTNINLSGGLTVAPAAAPGTTVGTLTTTDPNPGNTFSYTIGVGGDNANFVTNGNLLQVAPGAVIGAAGTVYNISITSTDQGGLFFTKAFAITVAVAPPVAPTYLILSNNRIAENAGANALVGTFSTTDANPSDTHTYSLVAGTGSTNNASFTIVGNELRAVGSFDYETKTSYNIRVRTTDQGGLWFERVLTIYVTNVPGA